MNLVLHSCILAMIREKDVIEKEVQVVVQVHQVVRRGMKQMEAIVALLYSVLKGNIISLKISISVVLYLLNSAKLRKSGLAFFLQWPYHHKYSIVSVQPFLEEKLKLSSIMTFLLGGS